MSTSTVVVARNAKAFRRVDRRVDRRPIGLRRDVVAEPEGPDERADATAPRPVGTAS
jgi:hypothetical protein